MKPKRNCKVYNSTTGLKNKYPLTNDINIVTPQIESQLNLGLREQKNKLVTEMSQSFYLTLNQCTETVIVRTVSRPCTPMFPRIRG
jgi:hypothetical protein